jgi:hypothetical protein
VHLGALWQRGEDHSGGGMGSLRWCCWDKGVGGGPVQTISAGNVRNGVSMRKRKHMYFSFAGIRCTANMLVLEVGVGLCHGGQACGNN